MTDSFKTHLLNAYYVQATMTKTLWLLFSRSVQTRLGILLIKKTDKFKLWQEICFSLVSKISPEHMELDLDHARFLGLQKA